MQSKDNTNDEGHTSRQDEDDEDKQTNNDNVELLHLLHHNTIIGLPVDWIFSNTEQLLQLDLSNVFIRQLFLT